MASFLRAPCLVVLLAGATLSPGFAQPVATDTSATANSWVKSGIESGVKGDLDSAIADFNKAIEVDPTYALAYQSRGHAHSLQNRFDDAIVDFNQAIKLNPNFLDAYYDRGVAEAEKTDFASALADFNKAIELNPKFTSAYFNRGHVKYFNGDLPAATADLNQAITLDPHPPVPYFIRGLIRMANDDREGATTDFEQSVTNGYPDASFWLWIVRMRTGQRGMAQSELSDNLRKPQFAAGSGSQPVGDFILGKIDQTQLLSMANASPDHLCTAWFYIGMTKRFAGDTKGALEAFKQAVATNAKISELYIEAQRQIASLQTP